MAWWSMQRCVFGVSEVRGTRVHGEGFWVTRKQSGIANVAELEDEGDEAFQTDACASMGRGHPLERFDILLQCGRVSTRLADLLDQEICFVYTLPSRKNLLSSDHEVE